MMFSSSKPFDDFSCLPLDAVEYDPLLLVLLPPLPLSWLDDEAGDAESLDESLPEETLEESELRGRPRPLFSPSYESRMKTITSKRYKRQQHIASRNLDRDNCFQESKLTLLPTRSSTETYLPRSLHVEEVVFKLSPINRMTVVGDGVVSPRYGSLNGRL